MRLLLAALVAAGPVAEPVLPGAPPPTAAPAPAPVAPAPAPQRCDTSEAARQMGLARSDWNIACLGIEGGRRVIAAVPMTPLGPPPTGKARPAKNTTLAAPPLVLWVALAHGDRIAWRERIGFGADMPSELREVLDKSEEWLVGIDGQALRSGRGVRVGITGHWGASSMSVREITLLYRVPAADATGPLKLVWRGLGNTRESHHDYCSLDGIASFQMVDDNTVEREMQVTPNINREARVSPKLKRALDKKCVVKPEQPRRFPVAQ